MSYLLNNIVLTFKNMLKPCKNIQYFKERELPTYFTTRLQSEPPVHFFILSFLESVHNSSSVHHKNVLKINFIDSPLL